MPLLCWSAALCGVTLLMMFFFKCSTVHLKSVTLTYTERKRYFDSGTPSRHQQNFLVHNIRSYERSNLVSEVVIIASTSVTYWFCLLLVRHKLCQYRRVVFPSLVEWKRRLCTLPPRAPFPLSLPPILPPLQPAPPRPLRIASPYVVAYKFTACSRFWRFVIPCFALFFRRANSASKISIPSSPPSNRRPLLIVSRSSFLPLIRNTVQSLHRPVERWQFCLI